MGLIRNRHVLKERRRELRRSQTEAEKVLWEKLRGNSFYNLKFFRQYSVGPYILDFFCPSQRLALEIDGGQHADSDAQAYDEARSAYLKTRDISVLRFWNNEVLQNMEGVLSRIAEGITPPNLPFIKEEE
jgi:very-short-patch-repair endonuclease